MYTRDYDEIIELILHATTSLTQTFKLMGRGEQFTYSLTKTMRSSLRNRLILPVQILSKVRVAWAWSIRVDHHLNDEDDNTN